MKYFSSVNSPNFDQFETIIPIKNHYIFVFLYAEPIGGNNFVIFGHLWMLQLNIEP